MRRKGYPAQTKVFRTKREAEAWARSIEAEMGREIFAPRHEAEKTTLGECFERYLVEVMPRKKVGRRRDDELGVYFTMDEATHISASDVQYSRRIPLPEGIPCHPLFPL
ncbi:hypothetical protein HF289_13365 [Acidithiobacillus ferrooxidans]|jgi:hypothetical protein|uniref:hypothetical protein n=1 Tax=Acidithiobacillus TaxID=119977 RepID=UPI000A6CF4E8|nr:MULTISPECIES: hypothetical protein [Acidithiobacillus]MBU2857817.1 hypothetical protein [Acidithiobacillus ferrooxidans]MBU2862174.1 hypothetical protein [Acidithiobacillus ferrooxidans]MCL5956717.1 hypothetical protein [Gammaproteobacteria bacterium]